MKMLTNLNYMDISSLTWLLNKKKNTSIEKWNGGCFDKDSDSYLIEIGTKAFKVEYKAYETNNAYSTKTMSMWLLKKDYWVCGKKWTYIINRRINEQSIKALKPKGEK